MPAWTNDNFKRPAHGLLFLFFENGSFADEWRRGNGTTPRVPAGQSAAFAAPCLQIRTERLPENPRLSAREYRGRKVFRDGNIAYAMG